jgi:hypothetical protein
LQEAQLTEAQLGLALAKLESWRDATSNSRRIENNKSIPLLTLRPRLFVGFNGSTMFKFLRQKSLTSLGLFGIFTWYRSKHRFTKSSCISRSLVGTSGASAFILRKLLKKLQQLHLSAFILIIFNNNIIIMIQQ